MLQSETVLVKRRNVSFSSFLKNVSIFFFSQYTILLRKNLFFFARDSRNDDDTSRRKNPRPKRAVNARTVLKGEKEEPNLVLCLRIPDEDDDFNEANHQMRKEETTFKKKGTKRKRTQQHECDVCEKMFVSPSSLAIFTRTRNRTSVMCAIKLFVNLVI